MGKYSGLLVHISIVFGLALLFFLPIIESIDRIAGLNFLLLGSLFIGIPFFCQKKVIFDYLDALFFIILIIFCASTVFSLNVIGSYAELMRYIAYFLVFVAIRRNMEIKDLLQKIYILMILVNSTILSFMALLYKIPTINLPAPSVGSMNLYYPVFGHNRIADMLIFAIPIAVSLITFRKNNLLRFFQFFLPTFLIVSLVLSFGRAAMLSLTFAFMTLILSQKINIGIKRWNFVGIILGMTTILFCSSSFIYSNFLIKDKKQVKIIKGFYKPVQSNFRLNYIKQAFTGFSQSPILGTGLDTFRKISFENKGKEVFSTSYYVHNHFLQMFTETGIVGGILFTILIIVLLLKIYKNIHKSKNIFLSYGIYIGIVASSLQSLIDYNWQFYSVFLFYWMGIALLMGETAINYYFIKNSKYHYILMFIIILLFSFQIYISSSSNYKWILFTT